MTGGTPGYVRNEEGCFEAPLVVSYPYSRTVGAIFSQFFTALRDRRLIGTVGTDGTVYCPPAEFDPVTGAPCSEWVDVGPGGTVSTWSWQHQPVAGQPLDRPFAWALIALDGSGSEMLHAVDAGSSEAMRGGMRVVPRWRDDRGHGIVDIECFVPEADDA